MTGTRAQSGDRYGSGTLHSRQFRLWVPPRASDMRDLLSAKDGITGEKWPVNFACDFDFHINPGFFDMPCKSATWETALLPPQ